MTTLRQSYEMISHYEMCNGNLLNAEKHQVRTGLSGGRCKQTKKDYKWNTSLVRIPAGGKPISWLFTKVKH